MMVISITIVYDPSTFAFTCESPLAEADDLLATEKKKLFKKRDLFILYKQNLLIERLPYVITTTELQRHTRNEDTRKLT
jgi:hypothetical protein